MPDKAFLDTNILLYAFCDKDVRKQLIAKKLVLQPALISVQIINEASSNLLKKFNFTEEQIQKFVSSCYKRYDVMAISKAHFLEASVLRNKYSFSYYDSLVVSSALLSGVKTLYSEDMQHGQLIENSLSINNPFL